MLTINKMKCTGCGACLQICPIKCITWEEKELGFRYPHIRTDTCIDCGQCQKVCQVDNIATTSKEQVAFAAVNKDKTILQKSTSGGVFSALASYVLNCSGSVYGCSLDPDFKVRHIRIEDESQLFRLRGSKYVQSDTENTFYDVKLDLDEGVLVLFSGTPCQVEGLKLFLGKEYENLILVDLVCHGVGSQYYFDKFVDALADREKNLKSIRFRSKEFVGWSCGGVIELDVDGNEVKPFYNHDNYYYHYYLYGDIYRESCYTCPFASLKRPGDFTLGDFWGVEHLKLALDTFDGCSLVIANNSKAISLLSKLDSLNIEEVDLLAATSNNGQLKHPSEYRSSRSDRIFEYETLSGVQIENNYYKNNKTTLLKGIVKNIIPYRIRRLFR